ncbi:MAG: hypothetical protein KIS86_09425, partial [Devosia sp.]|nr:hypothetical protein [Devosia sp.]
MSFLPRYRHPAIAGAGMTAEKLELVGAIAILAAGVEFNAEYTLWGIEEGAITDAKGFSRTDSLPITEIIRRFDAAVPKQTVVGVGKLVSSWCLAARPAFECRNAIFHGLSAADPTNSSVTEFRHNPTNPYIPRKRPEKLFAGSKDSLEVLVGVFGCIYDALRLMWALSGSNIPNEALALWWS